jgi:hypothetical protein
MSSLRWCRVAVVACVVVGGGARAAEACGAGIVSKGTIAAAAQRIFLSVRGGKTEIVVQVVVPKSPTDYGALIPLGAQPTLDPEPVSSSELDTLDVATQVDIVEPSTGGGGCGCGAALKDGGGPGGVLIDVVAIGPVTAASLRGDDGAAVLQWLGDNGFTIPAAQRSLVDEYAGAGRYFVAVKRSSAVADAPDALGIHITVDGDQRALPLRFTRMGAGSQLAFTIFVAAAVAAGPSQPYATLLTSDLDRGKVFDLGYAAAVGAAVTARGSRAFVAEYRGAVSPASGFLGARLRTLVADGQTLTRYSTLVASAAIDADADFYGAAPPQVPTTIGAAMPLPSDRAPPSPFGAVALAVLLTAWRLRASASAPPATA